ncbi:hypothetical protein ACFSJU_08705 [Paradesertivirga mongoliensis]|uniref:Lipoprotein n=1 Tax=Paradesertivirga mongoliensis TaxID=2100740 RepID=A0ABW4ZLQ6_9SPHI|nr:hypothetical protein [Pedobacter mongoliensis]
MSRLPILIIIYLCTACRGEPEKKVVSSDSLHEEPVLVDSVQNVSSVSNRTSIEKDNLLKDLLDFPGLGTDINKIPLLDFEIVKTPEINTHDPRVIDTIYLYKNKAAEFRIYKATDKYILYNFHVSGTSFRFKNGVQIGISQPKLLETLNLKAPLSDTITVEDSEGFSSFNFVFKDNRLSKVEYDGYLD